MPFLVLLILLFIVGAWWALIPALVVAGSYAAVSALAVASCMLIAMTAYVLIKIYKAMAPEKPMAVGGGPMDADFKRDAPRAAPGVYRTGSGFLVEVEGKTLAFRSLKGAQRKLAEHGGFQQPQRAKPVLPPFRKRQA